MTEQLLSKYEAFAKWWRKTSRAPEEDAFLSSKQFLNLCMSLPLIPDTDPSMHADLSNGYWDIAIARAIQGDASALIGMIPGGEAIGWMKVKGSGKSREKKKKFSDLELSEFYQMEVEYRYFRKQKYLGRPLTFDQALLVVLARWSEPEEGKRTGFKTPDQDGLERAINGKLTIYGRWRKKRGHPAAKSLP